MFLFLELIFVAEILTQSISCEVIENGVFGDDNITD